MSKVIRGIQREDKKLSPDCQIVPKRKFYYKFKCPPQKEGSAICRYIFLFQNTKYKMESLKLGGSAGDRESLKRTLVRIPDLV